MNKIIILLISFFLLSTFLYSDNTFERVDVIKVIDGDTVWVKFDNGDKEKVRFILIDTPELGTEEGKEAKFFVNQILENRKIFIEKDISERDKYKRLLRYIWLDVPNSENALDIELRSKCLNAILLLKGYAKVMVIQPDTKYLDYFQKYQEEAKEQKIGIWRDL